MGRMKVHELAKELNMQSKELVDKLIEMKYNIKSHLSMLEEDEVEKIKKQLKSNSSTKAPKDEKNVASKKDKKPIAPVIIRREVTRIESEEPSSKIKRSNTSRDDLGVVQRRTDTSMNIKYRTPPRKIGTITPQNSSVSNTIEKEKNNEEDKNIKVEKTSSMVEKVSSENKHEASKAEAKVVLEKEVNKDIKVEDKKVSSTQVDAIEDKKENVSKATDGKSKEIETEKSVNVSNDNTIKATKVESNNELSGNAENNKRVNDNKNNTSNKQVTGNIDKTGTSAYQSKNNNYRNGYENKNQNNYGERKPNNYGERNQNGYGDRKPNNYGDRNPNSYGDRNQNNYGDRKTNNYGDKNQNGFNRNGNRPYNKDGNFRNDKDGKFQGRDNRFQGNRDQNGEQRNSRPNFNRDQNNKFGGNRQPQTKESRVEKEIKGILANTEVAQKEAGRETVETGYKDKEKYNRKFEESTKKASKSKNSRNDREEISYNKLKDLQSESNFSNMFDDTESKMFDYYDLSRRKGNRKNKKKPTESVEHIDQKIFELTDIDIPDSITVKELAEKLKKQATEVIKKLMSFGILATLNNELDYDTAFLVASEFGVTAHKKEIVSDEDILFDDTDDNEDELVPRPPIVVVMGHVDHGKTSLLDAIRSTNVIEKEAGGITQHIGAYKVEINGREITFIDTPGHEAFTAMRARGAQVTDVAIIVVAADDGIMPQTVEAINHAKAAGVSIIVAINKIDKEGANVDRVKQEIMEYGLVPEEWGGDVICVPISATKHKNIDALLEMVLLVADMKELKSNPNKQAKGTVIEARLDKNTGITASLLVQRGTLNIGDTIVVGSVIGKVRGMTDDKGQKVKLAGPSTPVEVIGLPEVPEAGEIFYEVENEKVAKHLIEKRKRKQREDMLRKSAPVTLDNLFNQIEEGKLKDLNIIIKADLQGSVQALKSSLEKIKNEEARVRIIHSNVGGITESDITLAKVTNSIIIGFNVRADSTAKSIADKDGVEIKLYSVIYNAIDDVTAALKGMLQPKYKEVIQGTAEIRQTFKITNVGMIAGCYVLDGKIVRNSGLRVIRDNVVIHTGKLASLKRMKDDSKEVAAGYECGVQIENYEDIKVGDKLESFIMEEIKQ